VRSRRAVFHNQDVLSTVCWAGVQSVLFGARRLEPIRSKTVISVGGADGRPLSGQMHPVVSSR
jgi:hypothetical protein